MSRGTDLTALKKQYSKRNEGYFPEHLTLELTREFILKYGENPHQSAAVYIIDTARKIAELTNIVFGIFLLVIPTEPPEY